MAEIVINDVAPRILYVANGAQTTFTYPFPVLESDDLLVFQNETTLLSGYAVTGVGAANGGSVIFTVAPANNTRITLTRKTDRQRLTDFQENGSFRASAINNELDRLVLMVQEIFDQLSLCVQQPLTRAGSAPLLDPPVAGQALAWSDDFSRLVPLFVPSLTDINNATAVAQSAASAAQNSASAASGSAALSAGSANAAANSADLSASSATASANSAAAAANSVASIGNALEQTQQYEIAASLAAWLADLAKAAAQTAAANATTAQSAASGSATNAATSASSAATSATNAASSATNASTSAANAATSAASAATSATNAANSATSAANFAAAIQRGIKSHQLLANWMVIE